MGSLLFFAFSWWGILLQAFAIIHFIRRRPDTFWLWIILIGGWLGALVYIAVEAVPDAGLLRQSFKVFPRRKRIRELEAAILDNPSAGNYEELGDLYLEEGQFARVAAGLRQIDFVPHRLARSVLPSRRRRHHDGRLCRRPAGPGTRGGSAIRPTIFIAPPDLLAHAYANTGQPEKADALFQQVTKISTSPRPTTTTPAFWRPSSAMPKRGVGPANSGQEAQPCRDICAAASGPGSAKPIHC